jgi:hypothetical protein
MLVAAGARLVTDDSLLIDVDRPATGWPGVQSLRLTHELANTLALEQFRGKTVAGHKVLLASLPRTILARSSFPVAALYVLDPVRALADGQAVGRTLLPPVRAAVSLVQHSKLGSLLGGAEASIVLQRCAALVRQVPVYSLQVVRDGSRVVEVADRLIAWHGGASLPSAKIARAVC